MDAEFEHDVGPSDGGQPTLGTSRSDRTFERFFRSTYADTLRWLTQRTEHDRAHEAVQEAYIKAYERWWRVRVHPNRAGWVRRVALNEARRSWRRDAARSRAEELGTDRTGAVDDDYAGLDADMLFTAVLDTLPEQQRRAMLLAHVYQMTSTEGAEVMQISPGTFRYHLHEARRTLRSRLETWEPS